MPSYSMGVSSLIVSGGTALNLIPDEAINKMIALSLKSAMSTIF
jgi:hypothetical protein